MICTKCGEPLGTGDGCYDCEAYGEALAEAYLNNQRCGLHGWFDSRDFPEGCPECLSEDSYMEDIDMTWEMEHK